VQNYLLFVI